jgi:hypothetical protein
MNSMQILAMDRTGETGEPIFRAPSVGGSGTAKAQALECLIEVKDRMELCIREGLTAYEAFDSFYAEMVDDAIAACAATGETS